MEEDRMKFCPKEIHKEDIDKEDIVIGSLLGDAYIEKNGIIRVWHSIKQKEYVIWLMNLYSKFFDTTYFERICKDHRYNKEYPQAGFRVSSTNFTKLMRMLFYCPNKTISRKQLDKLTPLGLSIWYCDDGCLSFIKDKDGQIKGRQLILNTQGFSYEENVIISNYFKEKYSIITSIHLDKGNYRIWMNGTEAKKFLNLIKEYVPECMYYKLCYRYFGYKSSENLCKRQCECGNCPYNIV